MRTEEAPSDSLETALSRIEAQARGEWPTFVVPADVFRARLTSAVADGPGAAEALARLHASDLYLAAGCGLALTEAIAAFEARCFGDVRAIVAQRRAPGLVAEDVLQVLREQLFVTPLGGRPKIMEYSGTGSLRSWLRVVATRLTLNAAQRRPKDSPALDEDGALLELVDAAEGVDDAYMRALYSEELRSVFPAAFGRLSVRERLLLRQRHLDNLTLDELSALHAIHRATVKRQLAQARETVAAALRELLRDRLGMSDEELESLLRSIQSRFHLTLRRFLAPDA
jgi:RNA polymerase sigma-70 factor, ECF subfamily